MEWKPIVGEDYDKKDQVDAEMQHVCQELEVEHIDSLQSNMADVTIAPEGGWRKGSNEAEGLGGCNDNQETSQARFTPDLVFPSALHVRIKG